MSLRTKIGEMISGWVAKQGGVEKLEDKIGDAVSGWIANQPGSHEVELKLACPGCGNKWSRSLDLTKMKLAEAIAACRKCPLCGSEKISVLRD